MSEEKSKESEQPTSNDDAGNKSETINLIDRADSVAKRMEEANKKAEDNLRRLEDLTARQLLGGRAQAGTTMKSKEEVEKEFLDEQVKKTVSRYK